VTREALKLALEALEEAWYHVGTFQPTEKAIDLYDEARTAIKEALANEALDKMAENARELGLDYEPAQEPVGKFAKFTDGIWREVTDGSAGVPLYTSPPQRTWVGLTDEDKEEIKRQASYHWEMTVGEYADEVQKFTISKLKEKNT